MDSKLLEAYSANKTVITPELVQAVVEAGGLPDEAVFLPVLKAIAHGSCVNLRECARIAATYRRESQADTHGDLPQQSEHEHAA